MEELEVNGHWPAIEKQSLQELIVQEFWCDGVLEEPANVVYLRVTNHWFRLYFDCGIVFWRNGNEGLEDELASRSDDTGYPLIDLAEKLCIKGAEIIQCSGKVVPGGSEIEFQLKDKQPVIFQCINDVTSIKT
ncbi:hypothetical protein [Gallaecimonas sp. GXIMD1310]|uniref:hypothetical protein n=1 Tax=Gallaecimonas sp. GXIMD1310 TaxID=3131926 RepID=UPI003252ACC8